MFKYVQTLVFALALAAGTFVASSAQVTKPHTFADGETIDAARMNANFDEVFSKALKRDGSGILTGNVTASVGVTVDGLDISTLGAWTAVTHSAGNFTAASGDWTVESGDQLTYAYMVINKTLTLAFTLNTTTVSATPASLRIAIPGGYTPARAMVTIVRLADNSVERLGLASVSSAATYVTVAPISLTGASVTTLAASTNATSVQGIMTFEVQ
jgi:hypothetical protein